jgi:formylmethanofuran--tetrahydromethanopterin N-formyltransferase
LPKDDALQINGVTIADTFAEAFPMIATRLVITAESMEWARTAAAEMCGYASSVIACDCEAGVDTELPLDKTPDGRPGIRVAVFAFNRKSLEKAMAGRVGQCVLTCPTTACFNAQQITDRDHSISVGGQLRFFGDGHQISKKLADRRFWRIPVMDGEFVCEDRFGTTQGIGGGNLLICGATQKNTLLAASKAAAAMHQVDGIALPFPGGIVRSGSKVGSRYRRLKASTNDAWCPTLRQQTVTELPDDVNAVYEIVIDGLDFECVQTAMRVGLHAACDVPGILLISAGNYGGELGKHHFHLRDLVS